MLEFSRDIISFDYTDKSHLSTQLALINKSSTPIYYKFKVNRPRFYLVKPDRGIVKANTSLNVNIKLHKEGISEANSDKFKCCFIQVTQKTKDEDMKGFEDRADTQKKKFFVKINNLPPGMDAGPVLVGSELKSLGNTGSNFAGINRMSSTSYQNIIKERQDRVAELKNQIQYIQKSVRDKKIAQGPASKTSSSSFVPILVVGFAGLLLGFLSSVWI